jgi:hypothetical protein
MQLISPTNKIVQAMLSDHIHYLHFNDAAISELTVSVLHDTRSFILRRLVNN